MHIFAVTKVCAYIMYLQDSEMLLFCTKSVQITERCSGIESTKELYNVIL